jgi:hypothetical protein
MNNIIARLALIGIATFGAPAYASSVNLVTDGGFANVTQGATSLIETNGYGANLTNWTTTSNYSFLLNASQANSGFYNGITTASTYTLYTGPSSGTPQQISMYPTITASPVGGSFIAQDADFMTGTLSQSISGLTVGHTYAVSFYQALAQQSGFTGATSSQWVVSLGGQTDYSTQMNDSSQGFTGWSYVTDYFTATSTTESLGFTANGSGAPPMALLDGVSMVDTPEPASWTLMMVGLIGIVGARRQALGAMSRRILRRG